MRLRSFQCRGGCGAGFDLVSAPDEITYGMLLLENIVSCPLECGGVLTGSFRKGNGSQNYELTAKDLWLASQGMGMPEERSFDHVQVIEMLTQYPIVYVSASMKKKGRVMLKYVVLSNGKKLHFGEGATVYKIEEDQDARERTELRDKDSTQRAQEHLVRPTGAQGGDVATD